LITELAARRIHLAAFRAAYFQSACTLVAELGIVRILKLALWLFHFLFRKKASVQFFLEGAFSVFLSFTQIPIGAALSLELRAKKCSPVYIDYLDTIHPNQSPLKSLSSGLVVLAK